MRFATAAANAAPVATPGDPAAPADGEMPGARLHRLAHWCVTGRLAGAELELSEWQRQSDCPPAARTLLAALWARRGAIPEALALCTGRAPSDAEHDPLLAQAIVCLFTVANRPQTAARATQHLHQYHGHDESVVRWLDLMQPPGSANLPAIPDVTVEHLAGELVARSEVIPSLVAALRLDPDAGRVLLLRKALLRAAPDLAERRADAGAAGLCLAMAELALMMGDADDARRWAHRGLKSQPYSASLALVLARVSDDPALGPPASAVLDRVADTYPDYPDVQATLIRREFAEGRGQDAALHLKKWLSRQPEHPLALSLQRELAA